MELHQLRYVAAVARTGNFSRAAEQCHVSQPSLSQQIIKLEDELGEKLFDRMKREAKLTRYGEAFLLRAIRALEEVEAAKREARDASGLVRGIATVGVLPTIAPYVLPEIMAGFLKKFPGVEIIVQEDTTENLLKLLLNCEIDFALASETAPDGRFEGQVLFNEELLLAVPKRHPLARKNKVQVRDLENEKFIVMREGHCLGDQVLNFCERRDLHPHISFRSAQLETVQALVRSGLGISLIPAMAAQSKRADQLVYRSFEQPRPQRKIIATWLKQRPPGRASMELAKMITARFGSHGK